MRYLLLSESNKLRFVKMPESYMYQLVALLIRLHKENDKLSSTNRPVLPTVIAECSHLELHHKSYQVTEGIDYVAELEQRFVQLQETEYPLIALLTEIRALQAQLEFLQEEEM